MDSLVNSGIDLLRDMFLEMSFDHGLPNWGYIALGLPLLVYQYLMHTCQLRNLSVIAWRKSVIVIAAIIAAGNLAVLGLKRKKRRPRRHLLLMKRDVSMVSVLSFHHR